MFCIDSKHFLPSRASLMAARSVRKGGQGADA
jgi:hypothetical protein